MGCCVLGTSHYKATVFFSIGFFVNAMCSPAFAGAGQDIGTVSPPFHIMLGATPTLSLIVGSSLRNLNDSLAITTTSVTPGVYSNVDSLSVDSFGAITAVISGLVGEKTDNVVPLGNNTDTTRTFTGVVLKAGSIKAPSGGNGTLYFTTPFSDTFYVCYVSGLGGATNSARISTKAVGSVTLSGTVITSKYGIICVGD